MQESVQKIKKTTSKIKYDTYVSDIQNMTSLKMSVAGLISKGKDLSPYWNQSCVELSQKLLCPTETGSVDLDLKLSTLLQDTTTQKSWFSTTHNSLLPKNLQETLFPSSTFFRVGFMDSANILIKSRKIRIYPTTESKKILKNFFGISRYWYNQTVEYLKQEGTVANLYDIRKILQSMEHPEWAFNSPQRIREWAMSDACMAVKNAKLKYKKTWQFNEVSFRSKKDVKQSFGFDMRSLNGDNLFREKQYRIHFKSSEIIKPTIEGTRLIYQQGRWFVMVPFKDCVKIPENQRLGTVALDPGVRSFITYFNPKVRGKIGNKDFSKIHRLCLNIDKLISKRSKAKGTTKRNLKYAINRLRYRIKNYIDDIHNKIAYFLVKNFDSIVLPTFNTSDMVKRNLRVIKSKTARNMLNWSHFQFAQRLESKCKEYRCELIRISESYTSKTCSYCGKINIVKGKISFKCECGRILDRDYNGARGIYLRALSASTFGNDELPM